MSKDAIASDSNSSWFVCSCWITQSCKIIPLPSLCLNVLEIVSLSRARSSEEVEPCSNTFHPTIVNCICILPKSHKIGPGVPNHCTPRTTSTPYKGSKKKSTSIGMSCKDNFTPLQCLRLDNLSPLATTTLNKQLLSNLSQIILENLWCKKLWLEPESIKIVSGVLPICEWIRIVCGDWTPAKACKEIASVSSTYSSSMASSFSSSSSMKNNFLHYASL